MSVRVLHLLPADSPGAQSQAELIARLGGVANNAMQRTVRVADRSWRSKGSDQSATSDVVRLRGLFDIAGFRHLRSLLREFQPQIVHLWDPQFLPKLAIAAALWRKKCPLVVTFRHPPRAKQRSHLLSRLLRRRVSRFVADSEFVKAACLAQGWGSAAMQVIRGGHVCEQNAMAQTPSRPANLQFDESIRLVIGIGPLTAHKRLGDLIWAVDMLAPLEPRLRLAIVGDGPAKDFLEETRQAVRRADRMEFYPSDRLQKLLSHTEIGVVTGSEDGSAQGTLQLMAAGLPLVAARGGGNRELLGGEDAGLAFPAGDRGELARTLWRLLEEPELRDRFGQEARRRVAELFPAQVMASAYADLYRGLLDRHLK